MRKISVVIAAAGIVGGMYAVDPGNKIKDSSLFHPFYPRVPPALVQPGIRWVSLDNYPISSDFNSADPLQVYEAHMRAANGGDRDTLLDTLDPLCIVNIGSRRLEGMVDIPHGFEGLFESGLRREAILKLPPDRRKELFKIFRNRTGDYILGRPDKPARRLYTERVVRYAIIRTGRFDARSLGENDLDRDADNADVLPDLGFGPISGVLVLGVNIEREDGYFPTTHRLVSRKGSDSWFVR